MIQMGCYDKFSNIGQLIALSGEHINGNLMCLLMSGPENRDNSDISVSASDVSSKQLLKSCIQWPYDHEDESIPFVFTLGVKKSAFLVDSILLETLNYCPRKVCITGDYELFLKKKVSEVKIPSRPKTSASGSENATSRLESSTATISDVKTSRGASVTPQQQLLPCDTESKAWKSYFLKWCPLLQRLVLQVDIYSCTIFLSSSPLAVRSETGLSNAVHRTYLTRSEKPGLTDTTVVTLPHLTLSNAANKINLINYISDIPVQLPSDFDAQCKSKHYDTMP